MNLSMNHKKNHKKTLWITRTAVFTALLVVLQATTSAFGNTIVTGSIVNMLLIVSVMTCGFLSGISVAVISPVMAKLMGIGPFWSLIPFIIAGNMTLATVWHLAGTRCRSHKHVVHIFTLITAAIAKFFVLYTGIVLIAVPKLLHLPEPQATLISHMFALPQLITALLGGGVALLVLPPLKKALEA